MHDIRIILKCFFKGHKYNYSLGWENGRYEHIHFVCDRCNKTFLEITQTQIGYDTQPTNPSSSPSTLFEKFNQRLLEEDVLDHMNDDQIGYVLGVLKNLIEE